MTRTNQLRGSSLRASAGPCFLTARILLKFREIHT